MKIIIDKEHLGIQHNPKLRSYIDSLLNKDLPQKFFLEKNWYGQSFQKIHQASAKIINLNTKHVLAVLPVTDYADLLTEQAALRAYDSSHKESTNCIRFNMSQGGIMIIGMENVNKGYMFTFDDNCLAEEKILITVGDVTIEQNKDFSTIDLNYVNVLEFKEIE